MHVVAAVVLVGSLLGVPGAVEAASPAAAARSERCNAQTAGVFGDGSGKPLRGTPGDDVIVTDGSRVVDAGGGDDLICVPRVSPRLRPKR